MLPPISKVVLISTGDNTRLIKQLETGFIHNVSREHTLEICRLGMVPSLVQAYHETAMRINDPDALLIFCHQDVRPLQSPLPEGMQGAVPDLPASMRWARKAFLEPGLWLKITTELVRQEDTGIIGVAGAIGVVGETPWWQYPDVSGSAIHITDNKKPAINLYGPFGRVAVLDGICLMFRSGTYRKLLPPPSELTGFHYYDMDLCIRAHLAGLKNWTVPLVLVHEHKGKGATRSRLRDDRKVFWDIYKESIPFSVPKELLPGY